MDVVLIPTWRRPEMLWHTLENIKLARGADKLHYIFKLDSGFDHEVFNVIARFPFSYEVDRTRTVPYRMTKQSYSLLTGYRTAAEKSTGKVYLIEEDIFVARSFFEWHTAVHDANPNLFCSIAAPNHNRRFQDTGTRDEYYLSTDDYCSWGVCWDRNVLLNVLNTHAVAEYYENPQGYSRRFKDHPLGTRYMEQDGLLRRAQWMYGMNAPIAYPWSGHAYHAGVYGYNRGAGPYGSLADRIAWVANVCYSDLEIRKFALRPEWYEDSRPINLNIPPCPPTLKTLDQARNPVKY